jgi:cation transport ATPase
MNTFKDVMKEAGVMFAGLMLLSVSVLSYIGLALLVIQELSFLLVTIVILIPIGIPLGYYLLMKGANGDLKNRKKPMAVVINRGKS